MDLTPPLYEAVDPDVLDALFSHQRADAESPIRHLTFSYDGCEVRITTDGDVHVSDSGER